MERAIARYKKDHILFLCPVGHYLTTVDLDSNFGGSANEVELGRFERREGNRFDRAATDCMKKHGKRG